MENEQQQSRTKRNGRIPPIANGTGRKKTQQDVANEPPSKSRGKRKYQNAQDIKMNVNSSGRSFRSKRSRAEKVRYQDQMFENDSVEDTHTLPYPMLRARLRRMLSWCTRRGRKGL